MRGKIRKGLALILSAVLSAAMLVTAIPQMSVPVYAAGTDKNLQLGSAVLGEECNSDSAATVYFDDSSDAWRVIGYGTTGVAGGSGKMTLLANGNMNHGTYDSSSPYSNNYKDSNLQSMINTLAGSLTDIESGAIATKTLTGGSANQGQEGYNSSNISGETVENAVLWPLSVAEANDVNSNLRQADPANPDSASSYWWLRSPGNGGSYAAVVHGNGGVDILGLDVHTSYIYGVRPAFNLNLSSIIFTSAAESGKNPVTAGTLEEPGNYTGTEWKLTLHDIKMTISEGPAGVSRADSTITVPYTITGDNAGNADRVSVLITDKAYTAADAVIKYYGKLAITGEIGTSGTGTFTLPNDFDTDWKVYILSEVINADKKSDYASTPVEITIPAVPTVSHNVIFKVVNGKWDDETTGDKTVTVTGAEGETLTLSADQIPAVGNKPNTHFKAGRWNTTPDTTTAITGDTTYKYTYAMQDRVRYLVTFKVKNGSWDDGTKDDKTVTLSRYEYEDLALSLSADQIPGVGTKPDRGYTGGSWDVTPTTEREISRNVTYTYTYSGNGLISYTVAFDANGGSGTMGALTREENDGKSLPPNTFTYPRRKFTGWNTKKDGTGRGYANGHKGDILKDDGTLPAGGETITLYAQWDWGEIPEDIRKDVFGNDMSKVKADDIWYAFKYEDKWHADTSGLKKAYTGRKITFTPDIKVFHGFWQLWENRDYAISYDNNTKAAAADAAKAPFVKIKGKGSYASAEIFRFTIEPADIAAANITGEKTIVAYAGTGISAVKPSAACDGVKLKAGSDYKLAYYEGSAIDAAKEINDKGFRLSDKGTYLVTLKGEGNYKGEKAAAVIRAVDKNDKSIVRVSSLKVTDRKGKALTVKIPYSESVAGDFAGYISKCFDNSASGSAPTAQVMNGKEALVYGRDYTISVPSGRMSAGRHVIVIKGIEAAASGKSYIGSKNVSVEITGTKLGSVKTAGLRSSVEYLGRDIVLSDVFNKDDKNLESGWNAVTLYKESKNGGTTVKTPLKMSTDGVNGDYTLTMVNTGAASYKKTYRYPVYRTRTEYVDYDPVEVTYIEWVTKTVEKGGRFSLIYNGINGYTGTLRKSVIIRPYGVKESGKTEKRIKVSIDESGAVYSKAGAKPDVKVEFDGKELREGIDYRLSCRNNRKVVTDLSKLGDSAKPAVIIKGMGNFKGSATGGYFIIRKADIGAAGTAVSLTAEDVTYDPKGRAGYFMTKPGLKDGDVRLSLGRNGDAQEIGMNDCVYTYVNAVTLEDGTARAAGSAVTASDKVPAGTVIQVAAMVRCPEKSNYASESSGTLKTCAYKVINSSKNIMNANVTIADEAKDKLVFNNGYEIPLSEEDLTVTLGGVKLSPSDYEIVSVKNTNLVGRATVTIRGTGSYGGTKKAGFTIGRKGI